LRLLSCFTPIVTSLRGWQQTTTLAAVQQRFGGRPTSLGALSDAAQVFEPALLQEVIAALGRRLPAPVGAPERAALPALPAVAGRLVPALPTMTWALGQDARHRAAKRHVAFEVLRQRPVGVTVTAGPASARADWTRLAPPGGFYVVDRGDTADALFQELHDVPCHCLARVQHHAAYEAQEERPISAAAQAAGVRRDGLIRRLGTAHHVPWRPQPCRVVLVASGKTQAAGPPARLVLVTKHLGLDAELVALADRQRWAVELCFRGLKCVVGCRHLLSQRQHGVRLQGYAAIIASLRISLWVARPPQADVRAARRLEDGLGQ
jgi:Transposase DDE domain